MVLRRKSARATLESHTLALVLPQTAMLARARLQVVEESRFAFSIPAMSMTDNVRRVVQSIRNDSWISDKIFSTTVYTALRDGYDDTALDTIREVVPRAAQQVRAELSPDEMETVAQIILDYARKIQQEGEWEII